MILRFWLLAAGCGLLSFAPQEPSEAEQIFRKMHDAILNAKTISLSFDTIIDLKESGGRTMGSVKLKTGNKLLFDFETDMQKMKLKARMLSDGETMSATVRVHGQDKDETNSKATPPGLQRYISGCLARCGMGVAFSLMYARENAAAEIANPDLDRLLPIRNITSAGTEKIGDRETHIIEYTLLVPPSTDESQVKLWIDSETHLPLKRVVKRSAAGYTPVYTETWRDAVLDAEMDDAVFKVVK